MKQSDCPFCNIASEPERVIHIGKYSTSFLSNPRLSKGHSLIVPNRHIEYITELSSEEVSEIYAEAQRITSSLLNSIAKGVDNWTKTRPAMPETEIKINHVHLHVIPSNPGDDRYDYGLVWTPDKFSMLSDIERDNVLTILR